MGRRQTLLKITAMTSGLIMLLGIVFIIGSNLLVLEWARGNQFADIKALPPKKVGLLLGTSKYSREGGANDYYRLRLDSAVDLFRAGKIAYILVSGDNSSPFYNEPTRIRKDLIRKGIPAERIYRDYAGFRTLDSIIRAKAVFQLDSMTIISQAYHNKRALYIALQNGIQAVAFDAGDSTQIDFSNWWREILARTLAVIDVRWLRTQPRYLGPVITIGETPPT
ncbi:hypothetical protein CI610_00110 [invertebrate metagenome]|uniref:DUF218 domain-containing protein n=1 Tax=invertebrate metagenome TaxID=1711999 RepID=A0A2H9TC84_9ZZZZ